MIDQELIKTDLVTNIEHYRSLARPQKAYWDSFKRYNINSDQMLYNNVRQLLLIDITSRLKVSTENAIIVIEDLDFEVFYQ